MVQHRLKLLDQFSETIIKCKKRWNIQHVASVGQRKNLSPRRESNPGPSVHRSDALITTELLGDSWRA